LIKEQVQEIDKNNFHKIKKMGQTTTPFRIYLLIENGKRAMIRAVLTAVESFRWCFVHVPVSLRGRILPLSVTNCLSNTVSL